MTTFMKKHQPPLLFGLGLMIVFFSLIPYLILKENIWVPFHDQLDGEVLNYIYQAKYLFEGSFIPEIMDGISKNGVLPPAPFGVLFYKIFSPFYAYFVMQAMVTLVTYTGMFVLLNKATKDARIGFLCACLFAYLPLMPVYGLSIAGQPLLWYAFWNLFENKKTLFSFTYIVLYAGFSSFVLSGFAVCAVLMTVLFFLIVHKRVKKKQWSLKKMIVGIGILCFTYVCCNGQLFLDVLGLAGEKDIISHRVEMEQTALENWGAEFKAVFFGEGTYSPAFGKGILLLTLVLIVCCLVRKQKEQLYRLLIPLGTIFLFTVLALCWQSEIVLNTIRSLGPLQYFQADRISWLIPPLWYILLGLDFKVILIWGENRKSFVRWAGYGAILALAGCIALGVYQQSYFYHQLRQVVFPKTYQIMTWKQYYASDVMAQIDEVIGRKKAEYRVVSLGMPPAAAIYHGFYSLDGYSNNYSLAYKHEFRKIIASELDKNADLMWYFDHWGNRCYLMSAESGGQPMIAKNQASSYKDLDLNIDALESMGCEYILSAMEIENAAESNLIQEGVFETPSSYYRVYLYRINTMDNSTGL